MGSIKRLAEEVERGLRAAHPGLRLTVVRKLSRVVGAMINVLVLETERQDRREPWLRRLLKNPLVCPTDMIKPLAMAELAQAARHDQTECLSLDQTDWGDRMALRVLALRVGERALPLVWWARQGAANIGFAGQKALLETVLAWLPAGARVLSALPIGGIVHVVACARMGLPVALEGESAGGHRRGGDHDRGFGQGYAGSVFSGCAPVRLGGDDPPGNGA